jgi:hypothetical protein
MGAFGGGENLASGSLWGSSIEDDLLSIIELGDEDADYSPDYEGASAWRESLSSADRQSVDLYRDRGGFKQINEYQRGGYGSSSTRKAAGNLWSALDQSELPDGEVLWRGMAVKDADSIRSFSDKFHPGSEFLDDSFMSASKSSSIAARFTDGVGVDSMPVLFRMVTRGAKGAYISAKGKEPEHLLQAGARISVKRVKRFPSGLVIVYVEVGHGG